jgi:pilus assembly protein CpaB
MRGKSLALLILALGCGLVASLGITQVLAKRNDGGPPPDTAPVYVAKTDIGPGAIAGGEAIKLEQWPKDKIPLGALSKPAELDNRRARQPIYAGQPILERMLLHAGEVPLDAQIPKGMRVVTIPVGIEAIAGGLVVPGARCDLQVFMRADASNGVGETLSKTILQDIRVFAVNDITNMQQQQQPQTGDAKVPDAPHSIPSAKTVSLLVTPTQAEIVTLASQLGTIRLILRSGDDTEQTRLDSFGASKLFSGFGSSNRERDGQKKPDDEGFNTWFKLVKSALANSAVKPPAVNSNPGQPAPAIQIVEPPHYTIRIRTGDGFNDVILTENISPNSSLGDGTWTATNLPTVSKSSAETHIPISSNFMPVVAPSGGTAAKQPSNAPSPTLKATGKPPMGS